MPVAWLRCSNRFIARFHRLHCYHQTLPATSYTSMKPAPTHVPTRRTHNGSWQTAISVKGINMQSAQTIAPPFSFPSSVRISNTLDDFRVVHDNYDSAGSFSAKAMRPVWIAALLIAIGAGIAAYLGMFPEHDGAEISKPKNAPSLAVPPAAPVTAARDSTAATALNASTGTEAANAAPPAPATIRSETIAPVKAKANVAKPFPAPAKKVAPLPVTPSNAVAPTPQEAAPISPPAPIVEEKPVVPTPSPATTPVSPQVDPPKL